MLFAFLTHLELVSVLHRLNEQVIFVRGTDSVQDAFLEPSSYIKYQCFHSSQEAILFFLEMKGAHPFIVD